MRLRISIYSSRVALLILCFIGAGPLGVTLKVTATEADEKKLWGVWQRHQSASNRHELVVDACRKIGLSPANELIGVSQGLAAWHLLSMGQTNAAVAILDQMTAVKGKSPLAAATGEMGRRWLTRLDREKVKQALHIVYQRDIAYPTSLDVLKKLPQEFVPPLKDRWNFSWEYELTEYKRIKGLTAQRYRLQGRSLGDTSDLAGALARPYADRIKLKPLSFPAGSQGSPTVIFETIGAKPEKILLSEGTQAGLITFAYYGLELIILTDGDHWLISAKRWR